MDEPFPLEPPPGFRGFDPRSPVEFYRRHLPHWRQRGATYFVTFRLADSIPRSKRDELALLSGLWRRQLGIANSAAGRIGSSRARGTAWEQFDRMTFQKVEQWLDSGMGQCVLRSSAARAIVIEVFEEIHEIACELGAYVIMPNHVHVIARPFEDETLEWILRGMKRRTAVGLNKLVGATGRVWHEESYDRIVRDASHLWRCLQYVGKNPRKARLPDETFAAWVNPRWKECGWRFVE